MDATIETLQDDGRRLPNTLAPSLSPDMLLLAGRGFYGYDHWVHTRATGADLWWRVYRTLEPDVQYDTAAILRGPAGARSYATNYRRPTG